jgi:hypothetical protein
MAARTLRERVVSSDAPHGILQLHHLDRASTYGCARCRWTGKARTVATMDGNWRLPICGSCYDGLRRALPA